MGNSNTTPSIFLYGDSLTQEGFGVNGSAGWAALLANAYIRRADVLNRGYSGYNTRHNLDLLPQMVFPSSSNILFATIWLGANDASLPKERQHVPLEEYADNLRKIVREMKKKTKVVILMTPPPCDGEAWKKFSNANFGLGNEKLVRTNEASKAYGDACGRVAAELGCECLNVYELLGGGNGKDIYSKHLSDGLHLSGSGNTLVFEGLMTLIKEKFPEIAPMEGDGKNEATGIPMEHKLWLDLC